ncbi:MAG TPA: TMEM14 family protein [Acidobacteriota bacterium]|jgi:uncharacterized membrane protein (UPF0136 family)|nr:TMEM14 family protein [Acidobacteriota bacterium]
MRWMVTGIFGLMVIVGGTIGYAKARSMVSLVSGVVCGGLLLYAANLIRQSHAIGVPTAAAVSALLAVIFTIRWLKSGKFIPSGVLLIFSLVELLLLFR